MNHSIDIQLKSIQQKLQQLLKEYQNVQKENLQLKKELEKAKSSDTSKADQIQNLQGKIAALQLSTNDWTAEEKVQLEKRIDTYLKEIDKCLSLLNAE
jgi:chromosome segregation ATPase